MFRRIPGLTYRNLEGFPRELITGRIMQTLRDWRSVVVVSKTPAGPQCKLLVPQGSVVDFSQKSTESVVA